MLDLFSKRFYPAFAERILSQEARLHKRMNMSTIMIDLPPDTYKRLTEQARKASQAPEVFGQHLIETALRTQEASSPQTVREVLYATARARPLSKTLRRKIILGITLDKVRAIFSHAAGPSLSYIIDKQRGMKW